MNKIISLICLILLINLSLQLNQEKAQHKFWNTLKRSVGSERWYDENDKKCTAECKKQGGHKCGKSWHKKYMCCTSPCKEEKYESSWFGNHTYNTCDKQLEEFSCNL